MVDIYDRASEREDNDRELAIQAALDRIAAAKLAPKGACYNCDEPLAPGLTFCDADCSADHELRLRMKRH